MKNKLKDIIFNSKTNKHKYNVSKHPDVMEWVLQETEFLSEDSSFLERVYCILYDETPICHFGNTKKFSDNLNIGYRFCGRESTCKCAFQNKSSKISNAKRNLTEIEIKAINDKRKRTCVSKYGVEYISQTDQFKKQVENTHIKKYGVKSNLMLPEIKEKIKKTNIIKYGTEYATQSEVIKDKTKSTNLIKYGVEYTSQSNSMREKFNSNFYDNIDQRVNNAVSPLFSKDEYKDTVTYYKWICNDCKTEFLDRLFHGRIPRCPNCFPKNMSMWEKEISEYISDTNIEMYYNTKHLTSPYELDIYIPSHNLAIECNGAYWHSEVQGKRRNYHLDKTKMCESKGIQLIHIWDYEWTNSANIIKSMIMSKLGYNKKIYARKCNIRQVSNTDKNNFLERNHLQGTCPSSINLGLYYENELVSLMTFGKTRFSKKYEYELLRFCNSSETSTMGGASRLFKHFVRKYNPTSVISYADKRYSQGNMYQKLGFVHSHDSSPNYKYTQDYRVFENRVKYQKHKLPKLLDKFNPDMTEWENMQMNGYDRIWDCGNSVWIWDKYL